MKKQNSQTYKISLLLMISCLISLCSGCWLEDLIKNALETYYPKARTVSVMVFPPYPISNSDTVDAKVKESTTYSTDFEEALKNAVDKFNNNSRNTKIKTIDFLERAEIIKGFYDSMKSASQESIKNEQSFDIKVFAKNYLATQKQKWNNDSLNVIIFGYFDYKPNATAYTVSLFYYDAQADNLAKEKKVVTKTAGKERKKDLEDLMVSLLKRVYE